MEPFEKIINSFWPFRFFAKKQSFNHASAIIVLFASAFLNLPRITLFCLRRAGVALVGTDVALVSLLLTFQS